MIKIFRLKSPAYNHDCTKCKYMYTVHLEGEMKVGTADIYESCDGSEYKYIVRYSSDPGDYATLSVDNAIASYVMRSLNIK